MYGCRIFAAFALGQAAANLPAFAEGALFLALASLPRCVMLITTVGSIHALQRLRPNPRAAQGTAYGLFQILDRKTVIDSLDEDGMCGGARPSWFS
jgi:hypothetical protein